MCSRSRCACSRPMADQPSPRSCGSARGSDRPCPRACAPAGRGRAARRRSSIPRTPSAWNSASTAASKVPARHRRRPSRVSPRQRRPATRPRCSRREPLRHGRRRGARRRSSSAPPSGASSPRPGAPRAGAASRSRAAAVEQTSSEESRGAPGTSSRARAGLHDSRRASAALAPAHRAAARARDPRPRWRGPPPWPEHPLGTAPPHAPVSRVGCRGRREGPADGAGGPAASAARARARGGAARPESRAAAPARSRRAESPFEGVRQAEEEQHERDRRDHREQGFLDGHALPRPRSSATVPCPPGFHDHLSPRRARGMMPDAATRQYFRRAQETSCAASPSSEWASPSSASTIAPAPSCSPRPPPTPSRRRHRPERHPGALLRQRHRRRDRRQLHMGPLAATLLGLPTIPTTRFENACATSHAAFRHAVMEIARGRLGRGPGGRRRARAQRPDRVRHRVLRLLLRRLLEQPPA